MSSKTIGATPAVWRAGGKCFSVGQPGPFLSWPPSKDRYLIFSMEARSSQFIGFQMSETGMMVMKDDNQGYINERDITPLLTQKHTRFFLLTQKHT